VSILASLKISVKDATHNNDKLFAAGVKSAVTLELLSTLA
jgi:hypothetical protein